MHALLISDGSLGDTLPFLEWGRALVARGHRVTLLVNGYYGKLFDEAGLDYVELTTAAEHEEFLAVNKSWQSRVPMHALEKVAARWNRPVYEFIAERHVPGETIVASQGTFVGARTAQEVLGVPLATVHLQSMWLRSTYDSPSIPRWCPRLVPIAFDRIIDLFFDRWVGRPTNRFRAELGLPPVKRVVKWWWNSPQMVLGMFTDWFNPPQPDWPPNTQALGWLPGSSPKKEFDSGELERFLSAGEPPLVFSLSSMTKHARHYFEAAVEASRQLGKRAIFLAPHPEEVPNPLPPNVCTFSYVPLQTLLPRAAAHVHHGGSGTVARTLEAGIPQVVVPQTIDQIDIGLRLLRLGVSGYLHPKRFNAQRLAAALGELLNSPQVAERCRDYAERCRATDTVQLACDALERLWKSSAVRDTPASSVPQSLPALTM